jgi:hypothetical protein
MKNKIYGFPVLPKAGLGNMLIPWADCYIWCKDLGLEQIPPFWRKIRIGPYLRGERDKRQYQRLFINSKFIYRLKRLLLLLVSNKISAEKFRELKAYKTNFPATLVCFSDMNQFERLIGRHDEVLKELIRITRPEYLPFDLLLSFIGVHIRMGDFPLKSETENQINFRIPLEWYLGVLKELRITLGDNFPIIIFSDGTEEEIGAVLALENVFRSTFKESITDMLAIAKSTVIITSRSSYSLFGAYLGQVPSIWYKGRNEIYDYSYFPTEQTVSLEVEWMPGQILTKDFINAVKERIQ